ncbi:peptidylprolyl isomerase SurA [Gallaecimonas mangrovi]|uniref:peptidylprolyl isomerase SurA n=1 Tax=Gallaecimonas mangrovi TaxID=2291597 RepID=UPI00299F68F5|nr:peptidylprolyl isomerase SurA [Gallaecimonas mangrovi]
MFSQVQAKPEMLDKVAAIVDQGVILESDVNDMMRDVKQSASESNQPLPSDKILHVQVLDRLINEQLEMQTAKRIGLEVSDAQLDQTIEHMAQEQKLTVEQMKKKIESEGGDFASFREHVRKQLTLGEVRRIVVSRRIQISPQEIEAMVKQLDKQGDKNVELHLRHILIEIPQNPTPKDIADAKSRAEKVLSRLHNGEDFAQLAIVASSGTHALEGGNLGWINANEVPTLFADALQNATKGEIIGPLRSASGFHIIKVDGIRGQKTVELTEYHARHILLKPSVILSDTKAKAELEKWRSEVLAGKAKFADLAKKNSEDPGSASQGGDLGWADPKIYDPTFADVLEHMKKGEISEPFRSSFGWHIIQLLDTRTTDATAQAKKEKAYRILFNRKFSEEASAWLREQRNQAYIQILDQKS